MMEFLYFPEDTSDYIPAIITLVIFMAGAVVAMYLFKKKSNKEEQQANEKYEDLYREAVKMRKESEQQQDS